MSSVEDLDKNFSDLQKMRRNVINEFRKCQTRRTFAMRMRYKNLNVFTTNIRAHTMKIFEIF
jgi:hypothetical protein